MSPVIFHVSNLGCRELTGVKVREPAEGRPGREAGVLGPRKGKPARFHPRSHQSTGDRTWFFAQFSHTFIGPK